MSIGTRMRAFHQWGLKDNPFIVLPPPNKEERKKVFTGRDEEIEELVNLAERSRGIFLSGMFGIGKTILVLETLSVLENEGHMTLYAKYDPKDSFRSTVLKKLANLTGKHDHYIKLQNANNGIENVLDSIDEINKSLSFKQPSIIVLDDLDRTSLLNAQNIIYDTRQLVDLGFSVILLGHPRGSTVSFGSNTDILSPKSLGPLSENEMMEMMEKYLSLSRIESQEELSTKPFTPGAAKLISKGITELELTPRIFNLSCHLLLESAAAAEVKQIDEDFISDNWCKIAEDYIMRSIRDEDREYLKVIYKEGGLSEDSRDVIREIGGDFAEYSQVIDSLADLLYKSILIEKEEDGIRKIEPNKFLFDDTLIR